MNDEQLRQPSDMAEEQTGSNGNGNGVMDNMVDMGSTDEAQANNMAGMDDAEVNGTGAEATGIESYAAESLGMETEESSPTAEAGSMAGESNGVVAEVDGNANTADAEADGNTADAEAEAEAQTPPEMVAPDAPIAGSDVAAEDGAAGDELVVHQTRSSLNEVAPNASMEDLLRASEQQYRALKYGDVIEGTIMKVDRDEILVDIGGKTEGVIPSREAQSLSEAEREALQPGDGVLVSVVQAESNEGNTVLSLDRARQERAWRELQRKFEAGEVIQSQVVGHNKGGLLVNLDGIRGFVPSSQISSMPPGEANKQAELARLHNQTLPLKIIEINRNRNRLILSERQAMQEQREAMRTRLMRELESGQIRPGTVTSIADFGAFVDIGGADGLIHLSELSWKRVSHPKEVLSVGDRINVYVLNVDPNERKIALSLKRTQPEPWETISDTYQLGQVVRGTITQITSFGAFARLEDGIEGLIHVSELAEGHVTHPKDVVHMGQTIELKVIRIDPVRKRIGLSLRRMTEGIEPEADGATDGSEGDTELAGVNEAATMGTTLNAEAPGGPTPITTELSGQETRTEQVQTQPQAQSRQRDEQRSGKDRDRDRGRERDRDRGARQAPVMDEDDDVPMSALAQALKAHGRITAQQGDEATPNADAVKEADMITQIGADAGSPASENVNMNASMNTSILPEMEMDADTRSATDTETQAGSDEREPDEREPVEMNMGEDPGSIMLGIDREVEEAGEGDSSEPGSAMQDEGESSEPVAMQDEGSSDMATDGDMGEAAGDEPAAMMPSASDTDAATSDDTSINSDNSAASDDTGTTNMTGSDMSDAGQGMDTAATTQGDDDLEAAANAGSGSEALPSMGDSANVEGSEGDEERG